MYDVNLFADQDVAHEGKGGEQSGQSALIVDYEDRQVVHFHPPRHVPHSCTVAVRMGQDDDLVTK